MKKNEQVNIESALMRESDKRNQFGCLYTPSHPNISFLIRFHCEFVAVVPSFSRMEAPQTRIPASHSPRTRQVEEPLESVQRCVSVFANSLSASAGAQLLPVRAVDAVRFCGWSRARSSSPVIPLLEFPAGSASCEKTQPGLYFAKNVPRSLSSDAGRRDPRRQPGRTNR